jgi:diaminohydroxyphosphoribosylaminopyrimidine deaminase / 5-amino-6-(5-phosphoribosylamino)uracil reductase
MTADVQHMARAIELAARGEGWVEPNPMVGCVIVRDGVRIAEGWHRQFGGPHAEVEAFGHATQDVAGATVYVTLEPCCHHGKTPPCTEAIIQAKPARVVVAQTDPFPAVAGNGIRELRRAGIAVEIGLLEDQARHLNAPYRMLVQHHRPWLIAKWAMTLDGRIASRTGHSRWISNAASRQRVHALRGRVDAIMIGCQTALLDNPRLIAAPPGPRLATRIVLDSSASLPPDSCLVSTSRDAPVLVVVGPEADPRRVDRLEQAGCEVFRSPDADHDLRLRGLLGELGRRGMTNVLVEGGGQLLGSLFDLHWIDEVHVFIAPKIVGGREARSPIDGGGEAMIPSGPTLGETHIEVLDQDVYVSGRIARDSAQRPHAP